MKDRIITETNLSRFYDRMCEDEKSDATKEKYLRDVSAFCSFCGGSEVNKEIVISFKQKLIADGYAVFEKHLHFITETILPKMINNEQEEDE